MVLGPSHETAPVRSLQLVGLGPRLVLLVVVLADGAVQKQTIELSQEFDEATLSDAAAQLLRHSLGLPLAKVRAKAPTSGDTRTDALVGAGLRALRHLGRAEGGEQLFVGGSSRMAAAFDAVDTVRSVLTILEQQLVVVTLLRDILDAGSVGRHRCRARDRAARVVRHRGHAHLGRRRRGRHDRPDRPDPDELSPRPRRRPGGRSPTRRTVERRIPAT